MALKKLRFKIEIVHGLVQLSIPKFVNMISYKALGEILPNLQVWWTGGQTSGLVFAVEVMMRPNMVKKTLWPFCYHRTLSVDSFN